MPQALRLFSKKYFNPAFVIAIPRMRETQKGEWLFILKAFSLLL